MVLVGLWVAEVWIVFMFLLYSSLLFGGGRLCGLVCVL